MKGDEDKGFLPQDPETTNNCIYIQFTILIVEVNQDVVKIDLNSGQA